MQITPAGGYLVYLVWKLLAAETVTTLYHALQKCSCFDHSSGSSVTGMINTVCLYAYRGILRLYENTNSFSLQNIGKVQLHL